MLVDEILSRCGPGGQFDVADSLFAGLKEAQIELVLVHQEFRLVEEFRNELLDVVGVVHQQTPRRVQRVKLPISHVEPVNGEMV